MPLRSFLDAVKDTGSTARVIDFGTFSRQTARSGAGHYGVDGRRRGPRRGHRRVLQPAATGHRSRHRGPPVRRERPVDEQPPTLATSDNVNDQWTNWDSALDRANDDPGRAGRLRDRRRPDRHRPQPTGRRPFNPPRDHRRLQHLPGPASGPFGRSCRAGGEHDQEQPARILAVGVGAAVTQPASVERLVQIAGPQVVDRRGYRQYRRASTTSTSPWSRTSTTWPHCSRRVVTELCSPSLAVRKFVQTAESTELRPRRGLGRSRSTPTVIGRNVQMDPAGQRRRSRRRRSPPNRSERVRQLPVGAGPARPGLDASITEEVEDDFVARTGYL